MLNIVVACANGAGSSLMMKLKVQEVIKEMNIDARIHHCAISEARGSASYDLVFTALNFVKMFDAAKAKGTTVIGIKNVLSAKEIKEKLIESKILDSIK